MGGASERVKPGGELGDNAVILRQTQPTRASLEGTSADPPIPGLLAATAQWDRHVPFVLSKSP